MNKLSKCTASWISSVAFRTACACAVPFSTASGFVIDTTSSPMSGVWWNASESGWGVAVTQQYGTMVFSIYTYDNAKNPIWYIAVCPIVADGCSTDLLKSIGGEELSVPWSGAGKMNVKVGTFQVAFSDLNSGRINFTVDGKSGSKSISRFVFAGPPAVEPNLNFPITFKGVRINSLTLKQNLNIGSCSAILNFSNTNPSAVTPFLYFDVVINGVTKGQTIFNTVGLGSGSTAELENSIVAGNGFPKCDEFSLKFNSASSEVF
jgi:hypothetical protein